MNVPYPAAEIRLVQRHRVASMEWITANRTYISVYGAIGRRAGWAWARIGMWLSVRVPGFEDGMDDGRAPR
jgi:hypothetical protein